MLRLVGLPETKKQQQRTAEKMGNLTIRVPDDIAEELETLRVRGYGHSGSIFLMARLYMDMKAELGGLWWDVERAAAEQRVGLGVVLGRLAKATLEAQQKKR